MKKTKKAGMLFAAFLLLCCGCTRQTEEYSHTDFVMGTVSNITLYGKGGTDLEAVEKRLIDRTAQLEKEQLSWRSGQSKVAVYNRSSQKDRILQEPLNSWVLQAQKICRDSHGAADPMIGRLTRLWNFEGNPKEAPSEKEIQGVLKNKNRQLDLGAFGKGIGIDEARNLLKKNQNISGATVALGGSILAYGQKPDGDRWNIGIQHPREAQGQILGSLLVSGTCCISTSGDYEKYFIDRKTKKRYFHILDERTGYPVKTNMVSCTIVCQSGIDSDGLSTACFALGPEKSRSLLKKYQAKAVFVDKEKRVYLSKGLNFLLNDKDYKKIVIK